LFTRFQVHLALEKALEKVRHIIILERLFHRVSIEGVLVRNLGYLPISL